MEIWLQKVKRLRSPALNIYVDSQYLKVFCLDSLCIISKMYVLVLVVFCLHLICEIMAV